MQLFFKTRQEARDHSRATGFQAKMIDNGKTAEKGKRYACAIKAQPVPASRASAPMAPAPRAVITHKGHKVNVVIKPRRQLILN